MLLVEANRQCLQKLLIDFPEVCSALYLTEPYWQEDTMVLRTDNEEITKILKRYFESEGILQKLFAAIPVRKFLIETISPNINEESTALKDYLSAVKNDISPPWTLLENQPILNGDHEYGSYLTSSFTNNILLRIESALDEEELEYDYDMSSVMLEAVQEVFSEEQDLINVSTLDDLIMFLSGMFRCSPEVTRKDLFQMRLPKMVVSQMTAGFMRSRASEMFAGNLNGGTAKLPTPSVEVASTGSSYQSDSTDGTLAKQDNEGNARLPQPNSTNSDSTSSNREEVISGKLVQESENESEEVQNTSANADVVKVKKKPGRKKSTSLKPSEILSQLNLPSRYKVFEGTTPSKPTTRRTDNVIKIDNTNNIAYLKAAVERITSHKASQYYVLQSLAEGNLAATEVYYPQIIKAYKIYEREPGQAEERIKRTQEAASTLLSRMTKPEENQDEPSANDQESSRIDKEVTSDT